jgi:hypothetical protein
MISFKALAAAMLRAVTAATPAFAQAAVGAPPAVVQGGVSSSDAPCISRIYTAPGIIRRATSIRTGP